MTTYTATGAMIKATATDFDVESVTPDDINTIQVIVYDKDKSTHLLDATDMNWNADKERWEYVWDFGDTEPGTYEGEVTVTFPSGPDAVGYTKLHVKRRPVTA